MPDMAAGMIVQLRLEYKLYGQIDLNVLHWRVTSAAAGKEMFDFLRNKVLEEAIDADMLVDGFLPNMSQDCKVQSVYAQVIYPVRYRAVRVVIARPGLQAFDAGTNNIALSVTKQGAVAGRGKTGRIQIPGLAQKWLIDGYWDGAVVAQLNDHCEFWLTNNWTPVGGGVTMKPCLWRPQNASTNDIIAVQGQDTVRTMRRRTVGVGK